MRRSAAMDEAEDGDLVFTNFVDFDMVYGHRRDVPGYAAALEAFDARLPDVHRKLKPGDLVVLTADHGCDPTWRGTDHTRERVPVIAYGPGIRVAFESACAAPMPISARHRAASRHCRRAAWKEFSVTSHLKKVELHCHLEGAAPPALTEAQARKYGVDISAYLRGRRLCLA